MRIAKQIAITAPNRPGILAKVARTLADAKVNIIALTVSDSTELGVLRLLVDKPDIARKILSSLYDVSETDVLVVEMPNRPGSLASITEKLGNAHININYAYASTGSPGGQTSVVLKVQYPEKAMVVLSHQDRR